MKRTEQSLLRRFFASRLFLLVSLIVVVLIAFGYARAYYQDYKIRAEISNLQEQAKNLGKKKLESMEILKYVTSDQFVEEKARTELNMQKPGENVVIINNSVEAESDIKTKQAVDDKPLSNPIKWWYYFIHKTLTT